jgi:hypothetical protein
VEPAVSVPPSSTVPPVWRLAPVRVDVTSAGDLRLTHPPTESVDHFDARAELTQEQAAFALAADPRGYGNPDDGWRRLVSSTALEAAPAPGSPDDLHIFAVRYGPAAPSIRPSSTPRPD